MSLNNTEYLDEIKINNQVPHESTSVLMKVIIGILCAIALYVLITIIIGLVNKKPKYKMSNI
jgi:hypothetical protein